MTNRIKAEIERQLNSNEISGIRLKKSTILIRSLKKIFIYAILLFSVIGIDSCTESATKQNKSKNENPIDLLTSNKIVLKKDKTFSIKLGENGSIGFSNCWINQVECQNIEFKSHYYVSSPEEKEGCIGCGGYVFWKFKAVKIGIDTIKITYCPTGIEQKSCSNFQQDSSSYKELVKNIKKKVDRLIVVRIIK